MQTHVDLEVSEGVWGASLPPLRPQGAHQSATVTRTTAFLAPFFGLGADLEDFGSQLGRQRLRKSHIFTRIWPKTGSRASF